jgi:hypothetical protein
MSTTISRLRERYKPERIKVLFVAESPPKSSDDEERFFYNSRLERWDYMYRAVMQAVFPEFEYRRGEKERWLRKFQAQGYYLIDATDRKVNCDSPAVRREALTVAVKGKLSEIQMLVAPSTPIILIKKNVFKLFNRLLRDAGYNVIHKSFLPFPSHGHQARFVVECRDCLRVAH